MLTDTIDEEVLDGAPDLRVVSTMSVGTDHVDLLLLHSDGRDPEAWTRAVAPIYRPGDGTVEGTRRSSEMIYRAWPALTQLVDEGTDAACEVQARFLGEFEEQILPGKRGEEAKEIAEQFFASFIEVLAGEF